MHYIKYNLQKRKKVIDMEENVIDESSSTPSIKRNYIYNAISKIFSLLIPIIVTPYLARVLEADGNGTISFIASIVSYFVIVSNLGIETYGQKIISENRGNRSYLKRFLIEIMSLRGILTFVCLLIYYITFMVILHDHPILYAINGITLLAVAFDFTWFFQGVEDFKKIAIVNIIAKIAYIVFIFLFVKVKSDINIAFLIIVVSNVLPYFLLIPFVFKYTHHIKIDSKIKPFSHFKDCMVYFIPTIAIQIYTILDKTMIGVITKSEFENGYYEKAEQIAKLPITIITTMNVIMRSRISYYYAQNEMDKIKSLTRKSACFTMILALPIVFGIILVTKRFVPIYLGEGYDECIPIIYILSPLVLIIAISSLFGTHYYTPFGKQKTSNIFLITGAIVNLVLNSFLIYFFKARGAAIASVVAEIVVTTLYLIFARDFFSIKDFLKVSYKYMIASILMFVSMLFINYYLPGGIWFLILDIAIGVIIYFVLLLIMRDSFLLENLKLIFDKVKKILNRG